MDKIEVTREELYRRVWEKPMLQVAQEIGISDVGLKKACRRLTVPNPPRGYWAKVDAGKPVQRTALPPATSETRATTTITVVDRSRETRIPRLAGEIGEIKVPVPGDLKGCHPLITRTRNSFLEAKYAHHGLFFSRGAGVLLLDSSKEMMPRILRIYQALIDACQQLGWKVAGGEDGPGSYIHVDGEDISFAVREKTRREENVSSSGWTHHEYFPAGLLRLEIHSYCCGVTMQRAWNDTNNQRIEDQLPEFLANVHMCAAVRVQQRIEAAERKQQERIQAAHNARSAKARAVRQAYQKARQQEMAARIAHEKGRRQEFRGLAGALHEAEEMRALVTRVDAGEAGCTSNAWIQWAGAVADMADPFKNGKIRELLDDPALDASLDVDLDPADLEFPYTAEIEDRVAAILKEPLEKYMPPE